MTNTAILFRAAEVLLTDYMCVRRGEDILITADTETDDRILKVLMAVAEKNMARVTVSLSSPLPFQGQLADPYIPAAQVAAVKACDVWIDLAFPYFAGSHVHDEAMKAGRVRYLLGGDMDAAAFGRLFAGVDFDQYFDALSAFDEVFGQAIGKSCSITSRIGTDVNFTLAKSGLVKPRHAKIAGMYLVPGSCSIAPDEKSVRGNIVVTTGFHEFYEVLSSPVTLVVDGKVRSVAGGGPSRMPLERAMLRAGGGEYGSIIHFSYGMHPAARITGTSFIEDMRAVGSNAVGLGIPWWEPGGGENHPDVVLTEQTVSIEGEEIIRDGVIVGPLKLAAKAAKLRPAIHPARQ